MKSLLPCPDVVFVVVVGCLVVVDVVEIVFAVVVVVVEVGETAVVVVVVVVAVEVVVVVDVVVVVCSKHVPDSSPIAAMLNLFSVMTLLLLAELLPIKTLSP